MPSHTAASALIKLYFSGRHPWDWPVWQELTGVQYGLFPTADSDLPKDWSRKDAVDIESYFNQYNALGKEDEKIKFATSVKGAGAIPGRTKWNAFISKSWEKWGLHAKIIEGLRLHSVHPIQILVHEGGDWPNSELFIPAAIDTIGMSVFGAEAFEGADILPTNTRRCLGFFVQRSWSRIREQVNRDKGRIQAIEDAARNAFKGLWNGNPTKTKVFRVIRAVSRWRDIVEIYGTKENLSKAEDMRSEVNEIMVALGASEEKYPVGANPKLTKANKLALENLATIEEIKELEMVYSEYLDTIDSDLPPLSAEPSLDFSMKEAGNLDLGMELEYNLPFDTLASNLGFHEGLPYQFNKYRDPTGATTAWDSRSVFAKEPLKLHWHQLAGVQSVIRNTFTKEPNVEDKCSGILICDEVGLGKTALAIATIAFLNQSIYCAENGSAQPPILGVHKYLNGGSIQPYPHLIIAPGTIRKQWLHELKTFFVYKSVDLLVYDSAKEGNSDFWSPTGPFCSSQQRLENRIILTTHSSLVSDFQRAYHSRVVGKKSPWTLPQKHSPTDGTVFHQRFLTVTIDEAHGMRNIGSKYHAALRILQQASVKLVMTGTPLLTSVKDITSMGRLCGVPHFLTQESVDEEKEDAAAGRRAKKLDDDGLALRRIQIEAVRRMQMQFCGSILRRTVDSKTPTGQKLVDLPPHKDIIGILRLTQRETEIVAERAEAAKATITSANESGKFRTSKFYLEYRSAVSFAKKDPTSLTPTFNSLDEWEPVKSTKMDACARICHHYLSRDDVPDVEFVDGSIIFPTAGYAQGPSTTNRKILIYSEFPSMTKLLRNILTLHGIDTLSIDGKMSYEKRADVVIKFCSLESPRVFVFSTVGSAGLNLSIADVVIFFDQPWSAQDEQQIIGRAHRQPQKQTVKVIHLLAEDSADILMNNMARGKKEMFEAFVNKQLGEELRNLLSGKPTYADEDILQQSPQASESEAPAPKKRRRVAKRKPKESASKLEDPPEEGLAEGGREVASAHRSVGGKHETGKDVISPPPPTARDEMDFDAHDQKDKTGEDVISPPPPTARGKMDVDAHDQKDKAGEDVISPPPIAQDEMDDRARNQDTEIEKNTKQPLEIMQGNRSHIPEDNPNPTSGEEDFAGARSNTPSDFPPKPAELADPTDPGGFNLGPPQPDPTDPSDFYPGSPQSDPTDHSDSFFGPPQSDPVDPADSEPDGSFVNEGPRASPFKKTLHRPYISSSSSDSDSSPKLTSPRPKRHKPSSSYRKSQVLGTLDPSKRFSDPRPTGANNPFRRPPPVCTETQPTTSTNAMAGSSCMPNSQAATKARPAMFTNAVAGPSRIPNNQPDYSRPSPPISQGEKCLSAYRQAKSIDQQTRPALSVELFSKYPRLSKNAKGKGKA